MKLTNKTLRIVLWLCACMAWMLPCEVASTQGFSTTTVEGTIYLANGQPGSGTLQLSWPAFITANNQAVTAGRTNVTIGADGYVSVNLAPNMGATPAGLYYTAVYHLSDGSTSTEYWVVPAAAQASLAQVRAQVMPAAQAVQTVSKAYVDQSIEELNQNMLAAVGGSLTGPLYLNGDPTQSNQAANKHYVDEEFSLAVPLTGAAMTGPLTSVQLGAAYQVDQFSGADFGAKLQSCLNTLNSSYGGTCDARNFSGTLAMASSLVVSTANAIVQLPCATIATSNQIQVSAGTRNVALHGCALRGTSAGSGSQGGTVFLYSGSGAMIQIGDRTYASDTSGFHMDNAVINTTGSTNATTQGLIAYRTQEMNVASLYLLGNSNQTGITLDGTGNYTGGTFQDIELGGFGTAINAIGHQVANPAATDWVNASTFLRVHIDCPTNAGVPIAGTYGINLQQGDGNTFTGGDVEGCSTALHLGSNAQNNTIVGLRNENSINQVVADAGSSYNNWITGGTMFTGQLTDNGTRNSFLDTFHRSFNGLNGDWYGSQGDATITNHFRLGTGTGNERGLLSRYQTDFGYRWTMGLSDATGGEQFYQLLDELNNVYRLSIGQYNNGQASTNNQTVVNAAGTGAIVLNGSNNAGTGGVVFGSGGTNAATVATINNAGNAQFNGSLQVGGASTFINSTTVKNQADAEIDSFLWAGATTSQKESFTYKDYTGASQWYMVKDASNNWALNSAIGGLDSFKAYQSSNSGDTYINASNPSGVVRVNYETGSGAGFNVYGGNSSTLYAGFTGPAAIKFPGLAASSGHNCLQIDNSGYLSNTGANCGTGSGSGTVNSGVTGQIAYYSGNGAAVSGTSSVPVSAGGTGATTAAAALGNLGAQAALPGVSPDGASGVQITGNVATNGTIAYGLPLVDIRHTGFSGGAKCDGSTDIGPALQAAYNSIVSTGGEILIPGSPTACVWNNPTTFNWGAHSRTITFFVQGTLQVNTTWVIPASINVYCKSGFSGTQFQTGQACLLGGPSTTGTLTAGTTGGSSQTVSVSGTTNLYGPSGGTYGSAISVVDILSCTPTTLTRNANNQVTANSFSGGASCHIPAGAQVTVSGMPDSSYNGTFTVTGNDYCGSSTGVCLSNYTSLTWGNTGTAGSTSGGTISGPNEDTMETTSLTSVSGGSVTAYFAFAHSSGAKFGIVGVQMTGNGSKLKDIHIGSSGTPLWLFNTAQDELENIGIQIPSGTTATAALEFNEAYWIYMRRMSLLTGTNFAAWTVMMTNQQTTGAALTGFINDESSVIMGGIKMERGAGVYHTRDTVFERVSRGAFLEDSRLFGTFSSVPNSIILENSGLQDNLTGYVSQCIINSEYGGTVSSDGTLMMNTNFNGCVYNDYFSGTASFGTSGGGAFGSSVPTGPNRTVYRNGVMQIAENRNEGAALSPGIVPYAMANVAQNPASWSGGCTSQLGIPGPDSTYTSAAALTLASGVGSDTVFTQTGFTPQANDLMVYGGWSFANGLMAASGGGAGGAFSVSTNGSAHYGIDGSGIGTSINWDAEIAGDWWHPVVAVSKVTSSDGTSGQSLSLTINCAAGRTMNFAAPFFAYIPVASIPSYISGSLTSGTFAVGETVTQGTSGATGVVKFSSSSNLTINMITGTPNGSNPWSGTLSGAVFTPSATPVTTMTVQQWTAEVYRWREDLLHGIVAPNALPGYVYGNYQINSPGFDAESSPYISEYANNTSSGATLNKLICLNSSKQAQTCTTSSTAWNGIAAGGATGSTSGNTQAAISGQASCIFDGSTTVLHYVQISGGVAGDCKDSGSTTYPSSGAIIGVVLSANSGAGTAATVEVFPPGIVGFSSAAPTALYGSSYPAYSGNTWSPVQNSTNGITFVNTTQTSVNDLCWAVSTADNTANLYDLGIYTTGGSLLMHIGATAGSTFAPSTGLKCIAPAGGPVTLPAGTYWSVMTTNCSSSCAKLYGLPTNQFVMGLSNGFCGTSGGALNSSCTMPNAAYQALGSSSLWLGWHN